MTGFELYVFIICLVSFVSIVGLFSAMLFIIVRNEVKAIDRGYMDDVIIDEYTKKKKEKTRFGAFQTVLLSFVVLALVFFGFTFFVKFQNPTVEGSVPVPRVVLSSSMAYKNESNHYLEQHGLDDQFDTFDLIFTHELPGEFELELYDVVVYEFRGELIVHRIVGIEEPNEQHPEHRLFQLRGDAIRYSDSDPVSYSQMRSIYKGERIPYVGSFVAFMQSPAGYLCIFLVIVGFVATPLIERYMINKRKKRFKQLGFYSYW